jgi:hypothetical protein
MTKAEVGNWDEDFKEDENNSSENPPQQEGRKTEYMNMSKPGEYKVRLVGAHVKCRKRFKPYRATVQMNEKDLDVAWANGWPAPGKRYAVNVIDKTGLQEGEVGKLKVLEKGTSVFKHFAHYKTVKSIDPAGKEGPDFSITVKIPNDSNGNPIKLKTEYAVMPLDPAPFTEAEVKMIKEQKLWPLKEIYKSTSSEKIQEMWDALSDEQKKAPEKKENASGQGSPSQAATTPIEDNMENAPANSDDLFDDQDGSADADSGELF